MALSEGSIPGKTISGTGVVAGVAYAPMVWASHVVIEVSTEADSGLTDEATIESEKQRVADAANAVADRLIARAQHASGAASEVLAANAQLARDKGWIKEAGKNVAKGIRAEGAAQLATNKFVGMFEKLGGRQAERVTDLKDILARILAELTGQPEPGVPDFTEPSVLAAADLAPADTAGLDRKSTRLNSSHQWKSRMPSSA